MNCPKQITFSEELDLLLDLSTDLGRDHFSVDEWENKSDQLTELKKTFVNNWCHKEDRVMSEWVSVNDRLPSDFDNVLIWSNGMCVTGAYLVCVEVGKPLQWIVNDWDESETIIKLDDVTHWMPLPIPPKE